MLELKAEPPNPAFIGAVRSTGGSPLCDSAIVRAATAQKTLVQDPVFSNNQAAPKPAKSAPVPLAV